MLLPNEITTAKPQNTLAEAKQSPRILDKPRNGKARAGKVFI